MPKVLFFNLSSNNADGCLDNAKIAIAASFECCNFHNVLPEIQAALVAQNQ